MPKTYVAPDTKKEYPLEEARHAYPVICYRKDLRKAKMGSVNKCIIALGAMHDKAVEDAYIGAGKDAYICFKQTPLHPAYALHFTINARAGRVRDWFDTHKVMATKQVILSPPSPGRTLEHRNGLDKARREKVKNGEHVVMPRASPRRDRMQRMGVQHRPRAVLSKNTVSMPTAETPE